MFVHKELCDHCKRPIGKKDDGNYLWYGIRFHRLDEGSRAVLTQRQRMVDDFTDYEINTPLGVSITTRVGDRDENGLPKGGSYSGKTTGIVLPGVVCSADCFLEWMKEQVDKVTKDLDPRLWLPATNDSRAVSLED